MFAFGGGDPLLLPPFAWTPEGIRVSGTEEEP